MDELNRKESENKQVVEGCNWVPEYGAWMVEATPNRPYTGFTTDLLRVERNMRLRRKRILTVLNENEIAPTMSAFPMIGAQGDDGSVPAVSVGGPRTQSDYIGDGIINPHPRFGTLTANIRERRGSKVNIKVPLFRDVNTPEFKDFEASPLGEIDGCCGDSQQVRCFGLKLLFVLQAPKMSFVPAKALAIRKGRRITGKIRFKLRYCGVLKVFERRRSRRGQRCNHNEEVAGGRTVRGVQGFVLSKCSWSDCSRRRLAT